jgi:hypothetical protein
VAFFIEMYMQLIYNNTTVEITRKVSEALHKLKNSVSSLNPSDYKAIKSKPRNVEHEDLLNRLHYNTETGKFTWEVGQLSGREAGHYATTRGKRYIRLRFNGDLIMAHVLVWFYINKTWPESELDHINGDGTDNRIANLRISNRLKNNSNTTKRKDSKEYPNIFTTPKGRFSPAARFNNTLYCLGTYKTLEEAIVVRDAAHSLIPRGESHSQETKKYLVEREPASNKSKRNTYQVINDMQVPSYATGIECFETS